MSGLGDVAGHAFLSYVREDADRADQLQHALEAAGIPVWRDIRDLLPGQDWRMAIRRAISNDAIVFISCFSRTSLKKPKSYQNEELRLAIDQLRQRPLGQAWLIPVRFDDCDIPEQELGGGQTLTCLQRADLFGDTLADETDKLIKAILNVLGRSPGSLADRLVSNLEYRLPATPQNSMQPPDPPGAVTLWTLRSRRDHAVAMFETAVRHAQAVTDEFFAAMALAEIARAWAPTNPPRAARLFREAESLSGRIKLRPTGAFAREYITTARIFSDLCLHATAGSINEDNFWLPDAMTGIAVALGSKSVREIERHARSFTGSLPQVRAYVIVEVARALTDPRHGARLAREITDENLRAWALVESAKIGRDSQDRAEQHLSDTERLANTLNDAGAKVLALSGIAAAAAARDPSHAERLIGEAERLAASIDKKTTKSRALVDIAKALALFDPDRAVRFASALDSGVERSHALLQVARILAPVDLDRAERLADPLTRTLRTDPGWMPVFMGALAIGARSRADVISLIAEHECSSVLAAVDITRALAAGDPDRAERFTRTIASGPGRALASAEVALVFAAREPDRAQRLFEDAEHLAEACGDEGTRAVTLARVAKALANDSLV